MFLLLLQLKASPQNSGSPQNLFCGERSSRQKKQRIAKVAIRVKQCRTATLAFVKGFEPPTPALGGRCSIQLSYTNLLRYYTALCSCSQPIAKNCSKPCAVAFFSTAPIILYLFGNRFSNRFLLSNQILSSSFSTGFYDFAVHWWRNSLGVVPYCFLNCLLKYDTLLNPTW